MPIRQQPLHVRPADGDNRVVARGRAGDLARADVVHHRYLPVNEIEVECERQDSSWLGPQERLELSTWHDRGRQRAWRWGRMAAKQLIAATLAVDSEPSLLAGEGRVRGHSNRHLTLPQIEILSPDRQRPRVWCEGAEQAWSLSISHTERGVLAAICTNETISVGVDVTSWTVLPDRFIRLWFTPDEVAWLRQDASFNAASSIWAAKEAVYKACNQGEGFDPRRVEILPQGGCRYRGSLVANCHLQSWIIDEQVAVLARIASTVGVPSNLQSSPLTLR